MRMTYRLLKGYYIIPTDTLSKALASLIIESVSGAWIDPYKTNDLATILFWVYRLIT